MKILIAEDDLVTREVLKRMLVHLADEIIEANNGVEALELIEREDPDFLFTDLQMPIIDGMAVVEAVRSSKTHSQLPIVCMSSVKNKEDITRLVSLGISDYILKPLRPSEVHERLRRVMEQQAGWRQRLEVEAQPLLLVVDADAVFRQRVSELLDGAFTIVHAPTGAHALRVYQDAERKPTTILVARGLPMISDVQLVSLISKLSIEHRTGIPSFWLVAEDDVAPDIARRFTGVIRKSKDGEAMLAEFRRTILAAMPSPKDAHSELQEETATQVAAASPSTPGGLARQSFEVE